MNRWHRSFSNLGRVRHIAILCLVTAICVSCSGGGSSNNASTNGGSGGSGSPGGSGGSGNAAGCIICDDFESSTTIDAAKWAIDTASGSASGKVG